MSVYINGVPVSSLPERGSGCLRCGCQYDYIYKHNPHYCTSCISSTQECSSERLGFGRCCLRAEKKTSSPQLEGELPLCSHHSAHLVFEERMCEVCGIPQLPQYFLTDPKYIDGVFVCKRERCRELRCKTRILVIDDEIVQKYEAKSQLPHIRIYLQEERSIKREIGIETTFRIYTFPVHPLQRYLTFEKNADGDFVEPHLLRMYCPLSGESCNGAVTYTVIGARYVTV